MLWTLMFVGLCWLVARRRWRSAIWLGIPTFLLSLFGSTPLAETLVAHVEARVPVGHFLEGNGGKGTGATSANGNSTVVLVLGGGYYVSDWDPYGFALRDGGTRVLTGLELVRAEKASALVLGGALPVPGRPGVITPSLLERWIASWRLVTPGVVVTNLGICMNTHDEAVQFRNLEEAYHWRNVLLVTSALHMPRSVALFKRQGIEVEPMACDFKVYGVPNARFSFSPFPSEGRLQVLGLYLHEKIGWWVYRVRGWV